jgi:hypothetical protein
LCPTHTPKTVALEGDSEPRRLYAAQASCA